jgi:hypothetical protein
MFLVTPRIGVSQVALEESQRSSKDSNSVSLKGVSLLRSIGALVLINGGE